MPTTPPLPTGTKTHIKKKKNPSERQNPEEPANHAMTHADLHQTHHRDLRRSRHDLTRPKHWRSPTTDNPLQPQPNHDQKPKHQTQPRPTTQTPDPITSHNPLQPYPPLPLSTYHNKKKTTIEPTKSQPTRKNEPLWCWCWEENDVWVWREESANGETKKGEREENWNNEIEEREISREKGGINFFFFFF